MYVCTPLFVPSNLGETKLFLTISPSFEDIPDSSNLWEDHKGYDETYRFEGYVCYIWAATAKLAQRKIADFSKELERKHTYPIQSDRLYFLPLFDNVSYALSVTPQKHHERPVIRVAYYPNDPKRTWNCEIYASNLVQLQEALFSHERNLLKKRLQVLDQQRAKT